VPPPPLPAGDTEAGHSRRGVTWSDFVRTEKIRVDEATVLRSPQTKPERDLGASSGEPRGKFAWEGVGYSGYAQNSESSGGTGAPPEAQVAREKWYQQQQSTGIILRPQPQTIQPPSTLPGSSLWQYKGRGKGVEDRGWIQESEPAQPVQEEPFLFGSLPLMNRTSPTWLPPPTPWQSPAFPTWNPFRNQIGAVALGPQTAMGQLATGTGDGPMWETGVQDWTERTGQQPRYYE
jgi:hypothetical protein